MQDIHYTFILAAYRGRFLGEAVSSILAQTFSGFKLVVVNDASPDDIDGILSAFDDPRITYIKYVANTGGKSLARHWNNCLAYAITEYVILASDDDIYDPDFLTEIDRLANKYPKTDVIAARSRFIDGNGNVTHTAPSVDEYMTHAQYTTAYCCGRIMSSLQNHVFRRTALMSAGGFVEFPLAWHTDDATVLALSGGGVAYTRRPLFSFRCSGYSISSSRPESDAYMQKFEARGRFWHWFMETHLPTLADDADTAAVTAMLKDKLKRLSLSMLFTADLRTAWAVRHGFINMPFVDAAIYYKFMARKIWNDYKFALGISHWRKLLFHNRQRAQAD